jgi:DNA-binding transcriptional regulator GbsR (MarR family)
LPEVKPYEQVDSTPDGQQEPLGQPDYEKMFGTAKAAGVRTLPSMDISEALDVSIRHVDASVRAVRHATIVQAEWKRKVSPRLEELKNLVAELESIGQPKST